jgi:hypothetical protein
MVYSYALRFLRDGPSMKSTWFPCTEELLQIEDLRLTVFSGARILVEIIRSSLLVTKLAACITTEPSLSPGSLYDSLYYT